jgi:SAM-dependent methyltransferase
MSQGTSGADSTVTPSAGGQPVWDDERAALWLANVDARERQLQPVSDALFDRANLQPGECVLDVGVGSGPTTGQAWEAVRPDGSVTGIDIAPPMIAAARQRVTASEIEWLVGDAASYDLPPRTYDAVISRFGVMFFADPVAGFRNLCEATRPGGRLIVTVWSNLYATGFFASLTRWPRRRSTGSAWSTKASRLTESSSAWVGQRLFARSSTRLDGPTSRQQLTTGFCIGRPIRWRRQS